jgi:hypothetical protein
MMNFKKVGPFTILLTISLNAEAVDRQQLYGTWQLESSKQTIVATGEIRNPQGIAPLGFLTYGEDGRMSVIIVDTSRPKPADLSKLTDAERVTLFRTMVAYSGRYSVEGSKITHHVDVSWNEAWTGTRQIRQVRLENDILYITSDPQPSGVDGKVAITELKWKKLAKDHGTKSK